MGNRKRAGANRDGFGREKSKESRIHSFRGVGWGGRSEERGDKKQKKKNEAVSARGSFEQTVGGC